MVSWILLLERAGQGGKSYFKTIWGGGEYTQILLDMLLLPSPGSLQGTIQTQLVDMGGGGVNLI